VWLPCLHHYRRPGFPQGSRCWWSYRPGNRGWRSDHPGNRGWQFDRHPRWSDPPPPHRLVVGHLADIHRADDSARTSRGPGVRDSTRASRGSGNPELLTSPSSYTGATSTATTSAVVTSEGRTGGTSGQPSSDDNAGEAGLPAAGRQTHFVGHLIIAALSGAHLHSHHPHQPVLASCHGGRICCFDLQQYLGFYPSSC
jgi:hypothetical protein